MPQQKTKRYWAGVLDRVVWHWPEDRLATLQVVLPQRITDSGLSLREVLAELSDETLALAIKKNYLLTEAFEELFNRYAVYLSRWFFRWGARSYEAQDLIQQIFLKFFAKRLATFRPSESFRAYLWRAAHNVFVQLCRRKKPSSLADEHELAAPGGDPVQAALDREAEERIESALLRLPAPQQHILRDTMNGRTAGEIAQATDLPIQRVYALLFRARRQMERYLQLASSETRSAL
jgi:RNA polymerase sigma factor (sigma-70 family)